MAETTIVDHLRDEENFGGMELRHAAADEIEALRRKLYEVFISSIYDPADHGVTLDHQNGLAALGSGDPS